MPTTSLLVCSISLTQIFFVSLSPKAINFLIRIVCDFTLLENEGKKKNVRILRTEKDRKVDE